MCLTIKLNVGSFMLLLMINLFNLKKWKCFNSEKPCISEKRKHSEIDLNVKLFVDLGPEGLKIIEPRVGIPVSHRDQRFDILL